MLERWFQFIERVPASARRLVFVLILGLLLPAIAALGAYSFRIDAERFASSGKRGPSGETEAGSLEELVRDFRSGAASVKESWGEWKEIFEFP